MIYSGAKIACVWVEDIMQWVPLTRVSVVQYYIYEDKRCAEFKFEDKILTSYIEYKEM